ncbi:hypothetical protein [Bradyrhizobium sp. HKCCYLS20291]|uniref:hypothetical protein n=1 Tax=Bradyrhizobium sp. HKCCYLS20291 TaxID=3420766 RepID=UPI003EBAF442
MKDQGLGALGLIGLALALTVLVTVGAPVAASRTTLELKDWLGFAGNILSALVTLIAAYVAWRAVQAQIGTQRDANLLGVLFREEDRIERILPGLRDAEFYASGFLHYRVAKTYYGMVEALKGEGLSGANFQKDVEKALPNTDGATRRRIESKLYPLYRWAWHAQKSFEAIREGDKHTWNPEEWDPEALKEKRVALDKVRELFNQSRQKFSSAIDELENEIRSIRVEREAYEARLALIRQKINGYFADHVGL